MEEADVRRCSLPPSRPSLPPVPPSLPSLPRLRSLPPAARKRARRTYCPLAPATEVALYCPLATCSRPSALHAAPWRPARTRPPACVGHPATQLASVSAVHGRLPSCGRRLWRRRRPSRPPPVLPTSATARTTTGTSASGRRRTRTPYSRRSPSPIRRPAPRLGWRTSSASMTSTAGRARAGRECRTRARRAGPRYARSAQIGPQCTTVALCASKCSADDAARGTLLPATLATRIHGSFRIVLHDLRKYSWNICDGLPHSPSRPIRGRRLRVAPVARWPLAAQASVHGRRRFALIRTVTQTCTHSCGGVHHLIGGRFARCDSRSS